SCRSAISRSVQILPAKPCGSLFSFPPSLCLPSLSSCFDIRSILTPEYAAEKPLHSPANALVLSLQPEGLKNQKIKGIMGIQKGHTALGQHQVDPAAVLPETVSIRRLPAHPLCGDIQKEQGLSVHIRLSGVHLPDRFCGRPVSADLLLEFRMASAPWNPHPKIGFRHFIDTESSLIRRSSVPGLIAALHQTLQHEQKLRVCRIVVQPHHFPM